MADTENAAFWLPTHFLTDDDFLNNDVDPFGVYPPPLDSPVSSTESIDRFNYDNDNDDLLSELTRQLSLSEKTWGFSTSPQSTLTGIGAWSNRSGFTSNGSPNGPSQVPSPPLTPPGPKHDAAWELLYEAAGQVARLKMNAIAAQLNQSQNQNRGLLDAPRVPPLSTQFQQGRRTAPQRREEWFCHHQYPPRRSSGAGYGGAALGLPQSAWPPLKPTHHHNHPYHHHHNQRQQDGTQGGSGMRAVFLGGSGSAVKRQSTGTGVFIPRRFGSQSTPESRKKPTGCSTVLLPARVVQALNLDLDERNTNYNSNSRLNSGLVTDHEILMARRNAMLLNERSRNSRTEGPHHDIRLPSDWTY